MEDHITNKFRQVDLPCRVKALASDWLASGPSMSTASVLRMPTSFPTPSGLCGPFLARSSLQSVEPLATFVLHSSAGCGPALAQRDPFSTYVRRHLLVGFVLNYSDLLPCTMSCSAAVSTLSKSCMTSSPLGSLVAAT
eukprot:6339899-Amphidinium_carterae.1